MNFLIVSDFFVDIINIVEKIIDLFALNLHFCFDRMTASLHLERNDTPMFVDFGTRAFKTHY
jgi:hypothetical protein